VTSFDPAWEKTHAEREWGTIPEPRVIEFMERQFPDAAQRRNVKVLDLGTGAGAQAFGMAKMGFRVLGVDASASAIYRCKRSIKNSDIPIGGIEFVHRNITDLCLVPNTCDAVIDCVVTQHLDWDDAGLAVDEMLHVLKPGGWFLSLTATDDYDLTIPSPSLVRTMTEEQIKAFYGDEFDMVTYARTSHVSGRGQTVSWWQIEARKAA
jgi:SAM-dependent methyltransferase